MDLDGDASQLSGSSKGKHGCHPIAEISAEGPDKRTGYRGGQSGSDGQMNRLGVVGFHGVDLPPVTLVPPSSSESHEIFTCAEPLEGALAGGGDVQAEGGPFDLFQGLALRVLDETQQDLHIEAVFLWELIGGAELVVNSSAFQGVVNPDLIGGVIEPDVCTKKSRKDDFRIQQEVAAGLWHSAGLRGGGFDVCRFSGGCVAGASKQNRAT